MVLLHDGGKIFVLIGGDEIDARVERGFPSDDCSLVRTEVVSRAPAKVSGGSETIQGVETDPTAQAVGMIHQSLQARRGNGSPGAGFGLPTFFDFRPGVVPPSPVVARPLGKELLRRKSSGEVRAFAPGFAAMGAVCAEPNMRSRASLGILLKKTSSCASAASVMTSSGFGSNGANWPGSDVCGAVVIQD